MKAIFVFDLAYKVLGRDIVNVSNVVPICFALLLSKKCLFILWNLQYYRPAENVHVLLFLRYSED